MTTLPGDFSFISDSHSKQMLEDAYQAVTLSGTWDALRNTTPPADKGFMFSVSPTTDAIQKHMRLADQHSGGSYGWTMRCMEAIAKNGWETFVQTYK